MTTNAAADARRESARGNGVAHAGQFGHQAHSAPAGFADPDPTAEIEARQVELAGRLNEAMTSQYGPGFQSLRGIVETGEDGTPRLRVTETTIATAWYNPAIADMNIPERIGLDDFEGEIGQLYADRTSTGGHGAADEPVFELRRGEDGNAVATWEEDHSENSFSEDELHDAEFHLQTLVIDESVAHARDDEENIDPDEFELWENSTTDTLSDAARDEIEQEWKAFRERALPLLREAEAKYNYDLGDAAGDWYLGQIGDGFAGGQRLGTDPRAREIAVRLDLLSRELGPTLGDKGLVLTNDGQFVLEQIERAPA